MPYHFMLDDNSARHQPTHYNHYFKEGKRPTAHILSLPLRPVTVRCKQTKTAVVDTKCSTIQKNKKRHNYQKRNHMNKHPDFHDVVINLYY